MEKLGILGGMGPLCTAHFYEKIVKYTKANKDQTIFLRLSYLILKYQIELALF